MKVITWNCNMAFRKKYEQILPYDPDLLIVPECEHPDKFNNKFYDNVLWIGDNRNKGLAVFSFNDFEITTHESYCNNYKYVLPVKVTDNEAINLVAIWSQNNKEDPRRRYIGEIWQSLNYYKDMFKSPTIIAGDFNWNVIWDKENPNYPLNGTLTDVINLLKQFEIFSMYHTFTNVKFGIEGEPTLYFRKNRKTPYHIDYIFAPVDIINSGKSFSIGKYEDWISLSDHMPLIAELE
ncbi:endonuclease/exonuclease/phosphatase family protein [Methanosarcina sp. Z-7115]|uniref:Endonuclease/exonuclease/phosphatase family protein n=1 Tax=Methanosarcina baikalica TaxID=3073890 RepID=A0ABU2CX95_9EURY|nr:endonuclease/exonuclease/phosphatase family protein [Methanosarcina sp. Z-7115]MDR7664352.1 endonuclease/exonuclease/phosphatase family protein [Methanosarcina sp. Z-7115]